MSEEKKWKIRDVFNYNRYEQFFKKDDVVKIAIVDLKGENGESFWIIITEAKGEVSRVENKLTGYVREEAGPIYFKGKIDNELLSSFYPKLGEIIDFNLGNIIRTWC